MTKERRLYMLVRNCSGGIVFFEDSVLLMCNEKYEWCFPKGVIRSVEKPEDIAIGRVYAEAGIHAAILSPAGRTNYEFYSVSRQKPVCNKIIWYVMKALDTRVFPSASEHFSDGCFVARSISVNNVITQYTAQKANACSSFLFQL